MRTVAHIGVRFNTCREVEIKSNFGQKTFYLLQYNKIQYNTIQIIYK